MGTVKVDGRITESPLCDELRTHVERPTHNLMTFRQAAILNDHAWTADILAFDLAPQAQGCQAVSRRFVDLVGLGFSKGAR